MSLIILKEFCEKCNEQISINGVKMNCKNWTGVSCEIRKLSPMTIAELWTSLWQCGNREGKG